MAAQSQFPHLHVRQYASVVIDGIRIPCAITDQLFVYIPVLGVCDVVGIDSVKEEDRIKKDPALNEGLAYLSFSLRIAENTFHEEEIACINLTRLHTWLWGIDLEVVSNEKTRQKLLVFKRELADLAYAYYGRPMLPPDLKAEGQQFLTEEQSSRFEILEKQYLDDHPVGTDETGEAPEKGFTVAVSSESPSVEFIDEAQGKMYRDMIGILGRLADRKKVPNDKRKGYQRVEAGIKEEFNFTYYWTIPASQWEAIVRHCIQVYRGYTSPNTPIPPIFEDALKMKAKPRKLNSDDQPRLF
jgi:hypothetical protein